MPVRTRVGHSFIKAEMAAHRRGLRRRALGALLLPRLLGADTGMLAALHVLAALGDAGRAAVGSWPRDVRALRRLRRDQLARSPTSAAELAAVARALRRPRASRRRARRADRRPADGWWFNLRPSNTEPLLRLNVEAPDARDDGSACATRCSALIRG